MQLSGSMKFGCVAAVLAASVLAGQAQAVIVAGGDGTQNTVNAAAISSFSQLANVGLVTSEGSGIYLGNGWVLTAAHVAGITGSTPNTPNGITLGGFFASVPGSAVRLQTGGVANDLILFKLAANPSLPGLSIASSTPALNTNVVMVGAGLNRQADEHFYIVTGSQANPTWTETSDPSAANASGYLVSSGHTLRYGTNTTEAIPGSATEATGTVNIGNGPVTVFTTYFDEISGEGQGINGDSGGAVFAQDGTLLGMIDAIGTFQNQPAGSVIFGQFTAIADLSQYRSQILAIVPEPASMGLAGLAGMALLGGRRRRA